MKTGSVFTIVSLFLLLEVLISQASNTPPLILSPDRDSYPIGFHLDILTDPAEKFTIDDVSAPPVSDQFTQTQQEIPNFSVRSRTVWLRFCVMNQQNDNTQWTLVLRSPQIDYVDLYYGRPGGELKLKRSGDLIAFMEWDVDYRSPSFRLKIPRGESLVCYMRLKSSSLIRAPLVLLSEKAFAVTDARERVIFGFAVGAVVIIAVYNLFYWVALRDRSYLYYLLSILAIGYYIAFMGGWIYQYIFGSWPTLNQLGSIFSIGMLQFWTLAFARHFLKAREYTPYLDKLTLVVMGINLVAIAVGFIYYRLAVILLMLTSVPWIVLTFAVPVRVLTKGYRPALYYMVAYSVLWGSFIYGLLVLLNIFEWRGYAFMGITLGLPITIVVLSTALASRYNKLQREYSHSLELEIAARTEELAAALVAAEQLRDEAQVANKAKTTFLANMSHELRTPLNAILGFAQLMRRDPDTTSVQQEHLGVISRSGDHLLQLIDDVLTMSRIEAGRMELDVRPFDLYVTLDNIDSMLRLPAEVKNLSLQMYRDANVPRYVKTDEVRLRQVLINILGNAIKFTHNGSVILRVSYESPKEDGPSIPVLRFEVEDTGVGIAATETDRIFDPFVQTERGRSPNDGTGLGLPISRQFVRLMGGDISVTSEVGKGSTFSFHVEIEPATVEDLLAADRFHEVIGLALGQPEYRILIVEDNPQNRALLVKLLQPLGFQIKEASNGQEGIDISEEWEPHLIFMDMRMPVMDGFEATRRIKGSERSKQTKIIAVTASVFEHERDLVMAAGCDGFIRKPIRSEEIFESLSNHLGVKFKYAKEAGEVTEQTQKLSDEDIREHLGTMPAEWVSRLNEAAVAADIEKSSALLEEIRERDKALADTLGELLKKYRLDKIVGYTE